MDRPITTTSVRKDFRRFDLALMPASSVGARFHTKGVGQTGVWAYWPKHIGDDQMLVNIQRVQALGYEIVERRARALLLRRAK